MEQFDPFFFSVFNHYKANYKAKANNIALLYILILQCSLVLLLGAFFMLFFGQMQVEIISISKAWTLFALVAIVLIFRNWIYYTGKKRKVLNTKLRKNSTPTQNIWLLWCIPIVSFAISILLMQRV